MGSGVNMSSETIAVPEAGTLRGWFVALGVLFALTGIGALLFPYFVTLSISLLVGGAMLIGGTFALIHAFRAKEWGGFGFQLLFAVIYLVGGFFLLTDPLAGMFAITIILGVNFIADGAVRVVLALKIRPERSWGLFLASGLLSLALGVYALFGLTSGVSLSLVGLMVGINMLFAGIAFLSCTGAASKMAKARTGG
ncbi:MAG: DUF308 domain-containing protein [Pseudomonadota bacterium]